MNKLLAVRQPLKCLSRNLNYPQCFDHSERGKKFRVHESNFVNKRYFHAGSPKFSDLEKRSLPTLIYIQNPVTWIINKLDFKMLKSAWDINFDEKEFKRGTKQAISVICCLLSENLWDNLRGLVTRQALVRLQRDVEVNWTDEQKRNICIDPSDIKIALPRRVHFLRVSDKRFADVDMVFVVLKFKEKEPSLLRDVIFIEMVARFHRNYTVGQLPNWTVSLFKQPEVIVSSADNQSEEEQKRNPNSRLASYARSSKGILMDKLVLLNSAGPAETPCLPGVGKD